MSEYTLNPIVFLFIVIGVFVAACLAVIFKPSIYTAITFLVSIPSSIILCELGERHYFKQPNSREVKE